MTTPRAPKSLADRLAAAATTPAPPQPNTPTAGDAGSDTIKFTVHLDPDRHRTLKVIALDAKTPASNIIRALIDLTDTDPALRAQIVTAARGEP